MKEFFLVIACLIGFAVWAFFQRGFVTVETANLDSKRLIFAFVVPFVASLLVFAYYTLWQQGQSFEIIKATTSNKYNIGLMLFSAVGLAVGYILYSKMATLPQTYIVMYAMLSTAFTAVLFTMFTWNVETGLPCFDRTPKFNEILGLALVVCGIGAVKFDALKTLLEKVV